MRLAGITLPGNGWPVSGIPNREVRAGEVAAAHGGRRDGGAAAAIDRLVVRSLVVREEEGLVLEIGPPKLTPQRCCVRVGVGVVALGARLLLVVGESVQAVAVVVVERAAVVVVAAALGSDHDAGEAAVLGAVGVREHLDLRDGVEARGGVADRAEDGVRGGLAVLDVGNAVGPPAQELDVVASSQHVRVQQEEVLHVAAVAGQVAQLLLSSPTATEGLSIAMLLRASAETVTVSATVPSSSRASTRATPPRPHHHAGPLELLEGGGDDLDAIGAGSQVRRLEATLVIGLDAARYAGRLVDDQDGRGRDAAALGVGDGATQRAEDRLGSAGMTAIATARSTNTNTRHDRNEPCPRARS